MIPSRKLLYTVIGLLALAGVMAAEAQNSNPAGLQLPVVQDRPSLIYSNNARDASVLVRYSILADGSTADIEVMDGFYDPAAADLARNTVAQWRFTPATYGGEAVDWYNNQFRFRFNTFDSATLSPTLAQSYAGISEDLRDGEYARALQAIDRADRNARTLFDHAFMADLRATALLGLNRFDEALASSREATVVFGDPEGIVNIRETATDVLPSELLLPALRKRFLLAISREDDQDALATYQRIVFDFDIAPDDEIFDLASAARARMEAPREVRVMAALVAGVWRYTPRHRIFTVSGLEGNVERLDVFCKRRRTSLEFMENVEWELPASWGRCTLEFSGEQRTTFTLYEFSE